MNYKVAKKTLAIAIKNCQSVQYPVLVTGSDFGDDLALALAQVVELTDKVEQFEKIIADLVKDGE